MTFRQLQYFLEVARTLNFSKAAEVLYVSQSTLSKAIATLEEELGAVLFIRNHHNVSLTPAGAVLATNLPRLQEDLNKTIDLVQEVKEGMRGRLALGVQSGFTLPEVIMSATEYCKDSMPFLSITTAAMSEDLLWESLANGRVDFALAYLLEEDVGRLNAQTTTTVLATEPVVLCVSNTQGLTEPVGAKQLAQLAYVFDAPDSAPPVRRWAEYCRNRGFYPVTQQAKDMETVCLHVQMNLAAAVVPQGHALTYAANVSTLPIPDAYRMASTMSSNTDNLNQIVEVFTKIIESDL